MEKIKLVIILVASVLAVILLAVIVVNGTQNKAIVFEEQINAAASDVEVQEKRRVDLIYNLVDCVKEYDEHEYNTLKEVTDARGSGGNDISDITTMIAATAEAYPDLKANDNYKQLMNELSITENMIAEYRSNYNSQVKKYNRYVRQFPNKQFLGILGYEVISYTYLDFKAPETAPQKLFED